MYPRRAPGVSFAVAAEPAVVDIRPGDFADPRVPALIDAHVTASRAVTPPCSEHALGPAGLQTPDVRFWTVWRGDELIACAALRRIDAGHGELKSMYTAKGARRAGAASALLAHVLGDARAQGMTRVSLETGSGDYFAPARALYLRNGFTECGPFGAYVDDAFSVFMTRSLD